MPRLAGMKLYRMSARSRGPLGCVATTSSGHEIAMDLPKLKGGADGGPEPVEALMAALIGCKTATAHYVARHLWPRPGNAITGLSCEMQAERDPEGGRFLPITEPPPVFPGITRVWGTIRVAPRASSVTAQDVVQLGKCVDQRCPVAASLHAGGCEIALEWVLDDTI